MMKKSWFLDAFCQYYELYRRMTASFDDRAYDRTTQSSDRKVLIPSMAKIIEKPTYLYDEISIAPLATFRVLFGLMMLVSIIRFWYNGWIFDQYIYPDFYFTYYGFEWVRPLAGNGMYYIYGLMGFSALSIMLGFFYRITSVLFFLSFTYVELIDKTNYLNHYYFVSLISFFKKSACLDDQYY